MPRVDRVLSDVQQALGRHGRRLMLRDHLDAVRFEWQEVALIVDRTLLLTFVLVTFGATVAILLQAPLSTQFLLGHQQQQQPTASANNQQTLIDSDRLTY